MILSRDDLLIAEQKGDIAFDTRKPFSAFSLDVRLGKLYRYIPPSQSITILDEDQSQDEFMESSLEEISLDEKGFTLEKGERYFWQPLEKIGLNSGYCAEIVSRSSAARKGIYVRSKSIDEYLHQSFIPYIGNPLCTLKTFKEQVTVYPKDSFAQLIIMHNDIYELKRDVLSLFESGNLDITRNGLPVLEEDITVHGQIVLSMDNEIKVFAEDEFIEIILDKKKPTYLPKDTFFISSSAEHVSIPPTHVGYVTSRASWETNHVYFTTHNPEFAPLPFISHPNAPYIGPRPIFEATITFENMMIEDGYLYAGMKQSELCLKPLVTPITDEINPSRYHKQQGATLSKKK